MTTEMIGITGKLKSLGIPASVIKMVRDGVKEKAPKIGNAVLDRIRETISESHRAILILGRNGSYSVFSPAGHAALCASAKRNKPWESATRQRTKTHKH